MIEFDNNNLNIVFMKNKFACDVMLTHTQTHTEHINSHTTMILNIKITNITLDKSILIEIIVYHNCFDTE